MRRLAICLAIASGAMVAGLPSAWAGGEGVGDADEGRDEPGTVEVIEVSGLLDPVLVDFVEGSVTSAEESGAISLVLQLNSRGAVVGDDDITELARRIADSTVPVAVWVGPSGSRALGAAAQLAGVASEIGMAPGSRLGETGDQILPEDEFGVVFGDNAALLRDESVGATEAEDLGIVERPAPTIGDFIVDLPGVETRVVEGGEVPRREPVTIVRFSQLPLVSQLMHTVASPAVAYLLLVIALGLLVFELYTAGIGVAGAVGAGALVLACYGLWVLPVAPLGVGLVAFSFFGYAVDVQTGVVRVWTAIATVSFVVGTLLFYDGLALSWITMGVAIIGVLLAFLAGMPAMVRSRFSTPTIGREWMIGESGLAVAAVDPDGTVSVRDALWRAHTSRVTPIAQGDPVVVVGIDGLVLDVAPEEDPAPEEAGSAE